MRVAIILLAAVVMAPAARAEQLDEGVTVPMLAARKPLLVPADSKSPFRARTRLHFWVGKDGAVEATEQICGDRELFDDIVDSVLEFKFQHAGAFTTDISFLRRGDRVWLVQELPAASRPKKDVCANSSDK